MRLENPLKPQREDRVRNVRMKIARTRPMTGMTGMTGMTDDVLATKQRPADDEHERRGREARQRLRWDP